GLHFFVNYKQAEIRQWQLEATVKEAELRALKSQLNPHFLFNCLNSIRALVIEEPNRAQDGVTKLASILRYCLQSGEIETATLRSELRFVEDYIDLEAIRFEDRLAVHMQIAPDTLDQQIPPMTLQILVENGIKHGIAKSPTGGELTVSAWMQETDLHIQVCNTGSLATGESSTRLGVKNASERLKLIFGEAASLSIANTINNCVMAKLVIPTKRTSNASINSR
ncbi:MAG: histidine kinase, partial [Acidobacteriota bacterium]